MQQRQVPEVRGLTRIDFSTNRAGDLAEVYATAALMAKGATVFRNTSCDGKTDLCFKYKKTIYEVDVKLARVTYNGTGHWSWSTGHASSVQLPVYPLIVVPATGSDLSGWYCRWLRKQGSKNRSIVKGVYCPPGLENFWE